MKSNTEKLFLGARIRKLRRQLGLTQGQLAKDLEISPSYVNLIEANQRPLSANLLIKLATIYDFNVSDLSEVGSGQLVSELFSLLKDPTLEIKNFSKLDVEEVVNASPEIARSFVTLYMKYRSLMLSSYSGQNQLQDRDNLEILEQSTKSVENLRIFFTEKKNYFSEIDEAAEALSQELRLQTGIPNAALSDRLKQKHNIRVRIVPHETMPDRLSFFDPHRGSLNLSELMPISSQRFQMAMHLALLEQGGLIDEEIKNCGYEDLDTIRLIRISLANYYAAAVLMPYQRFLLSCEQSQYDIELLSHRFGTSYEQTAHRLTTLQRPDARGIPFFFVRVDTAGNISKRFSAGKFHFSSFGGTCPLWSIHSCFDTPEQIQPQIIAMPDGMTYFSIARTVQRNSGIYTQPTLRYAIGLACDISHASRLIYSNHFDLENLQPTPIGTNCYLCERENCAARAHAPINSKLSYSERERNISLFRFYNDRNK